MSGSSGAGLPPSVGSGRARRPAVPRPLRPDGPARGRDDRRGPALPDDAAGRRSRSARACGSSPSTARTPPPTWRRTPGSARTRRWRTCGRSPPRSTSSPSTTSTCPGRARAGARGRRGAGATRAAPPCCTRRTSWSSAAGSPPSGSRSRPSPRSAPARTGSATWSAFGDTHGWPVVVKAVTGGYDGKGVWVVDDAEAAPRARHLGRRHAPVRGAAGVPAARALGAGRPVPVRPGGGLPGGRDGAGRRDLRRGDRPGARPAPRPGGPGPRAGPASSPASSTSWA